jgi:hypothetical protein
MNRKIILQKHWCTSTQDINGKEHHHFNEQALTHLSQYRVVKSILHMSQNAITCYQSKLSPESIPLKHQPN